MEQIKDLMKSVVNCVSAQVTSMENADSKELSDAMDMIKDLAMAKYYCAITDAMEKPENVYGRDYDENGRIRKGYSPKMRVPKDWDYEEDMMPYTNGMMPYSNGNMNSGSNMNGNMRGYNTMNPSRYDNARRGYESSQDMSALSKIFDIIEEDMKELKPLMTNQDKQTAHQRLTDLANTVRV